MLHYAKPTRESVLENWWFINEFLSDEEIERIELNVKGLDYKDATIVANSNVNEEYRKSSIKWIDFNYEWIYDKLWHWANIANDDIWGFDIEGFKDECQYTHYKAPDGHYDWHTDIGGNGINHRKISAIVQLSDNSEFKGGNLEFLNGKDPIQIEMWKGRCVLFPSFYLHRITPILEGERKSLVQWISGAPFK
tara:strand:+ start:486 stop:1064 length:579 start_codon:yes stop_codon:yes gene_type:complete